MQQIYINILVQNDTFITIINTFMIYSVYLNLISALVRIYLIVKYFNTTP